jgi:aromatic-L-amino-acid decarboxylase
MVPGLKAREKGLAGRGEVKPLRLYASEQAHSSIEKAAIILGIGTEGVRKIPVDSEFRMNPQLLERAVQEDRNEGRLPFCVVATVGTTSSTSVDPVPAIAEICDRHRLWLHVDAAYGGSAAVCPEMSWILEGCDRAQSFVMNPQKWMFTPLDLSALYCRHPEVLRRAFSLVPEYLTSSDGESVTNYMEYGVQLGRRFRALRLWMVIRYFGSSGIAERIGSHIHLAQELASWIDDDPDFERLAPTPFSTVCFRAKPRGVAKEDLDGFNEKLLEAVNATGKLFISHTRLRDRFSLRIAIGNLRTTREHVKTAWDLLRQEAGRMRADFKPGDL